jgi:hypothetical protein
VDAHAQIHCERAYVTPSTNLERLVRCIGVGECFRIESSTCIWKVCVYTIVEVGIIRVVISLIYQLTFRRDEMPDYACNLNR